ncbi:MAG TPA: ATP-binding protein [Solirubrobacteraceae bacterium]|nr:ATP-binding protein [Solirubrobacteraceae bacterium]
MRRRQAVGALLTGTLTVIGLMVLFAGQLSSNQSASRRNLELQAHQRAMLVANLVDTVFAAISKPSAATAAAYGAPHVSAAVMNRNRGGNLYVALFDGSGHLLAHSAGVSAQARSELNVHRSAALRLTVAGQPWALGNILPYGAASVINFAVRLSTAAGTRIVLSGIPTAAMSPFLLAELRRIPAARGADHSMLDGNGVIIASTNPTHPPGYRFHTAAQLRVLRHRSGTTAGRYFDQIALPHTTWRLLLSVPAASFFAAVSGQRHWLPWIIFAAFGVFALIALGLGLRAARSAAALTDAHDRLEAAHGELGAAHAALAETNLALERSHEELERRARELQRSNAELEQFASIASHDLQEPLRKVRTFTERIIATEGEHLTERGQIDLRRAGASAERMQQLIEDLLRYSRVATQGRPFSEVDLGPVAAEVLDDLEDVITASGAVIRVGDLPTLAADPLQMRQLLQNLVSNALKFRREGVVPEVDISATADADWIRLTVRDNGIGFEPQYAQRIFRVFERLHGHGAYPGTGIGLALCRRIAERHGGSVQATGTLGEGSAFTVTLQAHRTEAVSDQPSPAASASAPAGPAASPSAPATAGEPDAAHHRRPEESHVRV